MASDPASSRAERTRQTLLQTSETILATEGYAALTEEHLCALSKVTRGALRYHFPTGLYELLACYVEGQIVRQEAIFAALGVISPRDRFIWVLLTLRARMPSAGSMSLLELWMACRGDRKLAAAILPQLQAAWADFLDEGHAASDELLTLRFLVHGASMYCFSQNFNASRLGSAIDWILQRLLEPDEMQERLSQLGKLVHARPS